MLAYARKKRPLTLQKKTTQPNPVIQRKVGMEYQTHGGAANVRVQKNGVGPFTTPEHGETIADKGSFTVETDGTDLEYVVKAIDDTQTAAPNTLRDNALRAAAIHQGIMNTKEDVLDNTTKHDGYLLTTVGTDVYKLYTNGQTNAHPQATVGVRKEKIYDLIRGVGHGTTSSFQSLGYGGTVGFGGDTGKRAEQQTRVGEATDAVNTHATTLDITDSGKGFLAIIAQYVKVGRHLKAKSGSRANAKNAMPVMSRTSLKSLWDALDADDRTKITDLMTLATHRPKREDIFGKTAAKRQISQQSGSTLTVGDWFNHLTTANEDQLEGNYHSVSELGPKSTGWHGKYGINDPTDIGWGDDKKGAIFELRALQRNVPPQDWGTIASAVVVIARSLNK